MSNHNQTQDEIEQMIIDDGYIDNNHLWRKWIMIQILHQYSETKSPSFYTDFINSKPYVYTWESAINEIYSLSEINKTESKIRTCFFNHNVIADMIDKYVKDTIRNISVELISKPLYCVPTANITVCRDGMEPKYKNTITESALKQKIRKYETLIKNYCHDINNGRKSYRHLHKILSEFINHCPMLPNNNKSNEWINAFTGSGAYYTMDNLIKFHNCHLIENKHILNTKDSLAKLNKYVETYKNNYNDLFTLMLEFFDYNKSQIDNILNKNKSS